jgi:DNA-binding transcriptional ArsR family regulator
MPRASRELALLVLQEPQAVMERFQALLASYWEAAFRDEWARVQPMLADGINRAARVIAGAGLMAFLEGLRPEVRVHRQAGAFSLKHGHDHEVRLVVDDLLLMVPSVYVWPDVGVNCDAPWHYALVYPAPAVVAKVRSGIPPQELLKVLRALGDDTRLRVLRILAEGPRSTQELAALAHVSEATMSKHLRILAEAGVLSSAREGYYVLYALIQERMAYLPAALTAFLTPGCAPRQS